MKKRIGLLIEIEGTVDIEGYKTAMRNGITKRCRELDTELVCLAGGSWVRSPYHLNEPQRNSLYRLIRKEDLDGILFIFTVSSYCTPEEGKDFYSILEGIPTVSLGVSGQNYPSVSVNNKNGISQLVDHLVTEHGFSRIAYIGGPEGNLEARERFSAYCSALEKHHLPLDDKLLDSGDFLSPSGEKAAARLLGHQKLPEAILCANDQMAIGAMKSIFERGFRVPEDIAVVGFDDTEKADVLNPPLTTIAQPFETMTREAVDLLFRAIEGKAEQNEAMLFDPQLVIRGSCGCLTEDIKILENVVEMSSTLGQKDIEAYLNNEMQVLGVEDRYIRRISSGLADYIASPGKNRRSDLLKALRDCLNTLQRDEFSYLEWSRFFSHLNCLIHCKGEDHTVLPHISILFQQIRLLLGEYRRVVESETRLQVQFRMESLQNLSRSMFRCFTLEDVYDLLTDILLEFGIQNYKLYLFPSGLINPGMSLPENITREIYCVSHVEFGEEQIFDPVLQPTAEILNRQNMKMGFSGSCVVEMLFAADKKIGILVLDQAVNESIFYESFRNALSSTLYQIHTHLEKDQLTRKLKKTLMELEMSNQQLKEISFRDPLTNLYNRRGFLTFASHTLSLARRESRPCLILYADMDNMKQINDKYGHAEGDRALCEFAAALKDVFRASDGICRMGGDEFLVLAFDSGSSDFLSICTRIDEQLSIRSRKLGKNYIVESSYGGSEYTPESGASLEELIQEADKALYQNKAFKKEGKV